MKYLIIIITILLCISQSSCKKDFLDKTDPTRVGAEIFFKNEVQMNQAINGIYGQLQGITNIDYLFKEMVSDNTGLQIHPSDRGGAAGWEAFEFSTVNSGNGEINGLWIRYYNTLYNVNNAIEKLAGADMPDAAKINAEGELKFIRAYLYFDLVRYFGDVVLALATLKTPNEAFELLRSPQAEVYAQIENDLKDAIAKMPEKQPAEKLGRAAKGAALSLLGKVYLTNKRYDDAVTTLKQVLTLGYSLMPSYTDVFDPAKKNNAESIFEIQYQGNNDQGEHSSFTYTFAPIFSGAAVTGYDVGRLGGRNTPT
ncbi:MAG TPA: RagB/SusD family nutrient uptake outer membrane protein, partial [Chitinophagaceae bacterium]|nr:RagB/SusD family nutrient uptake outer membrane protein [Chitinophagaceae bacterium]